MFRSITALSIIFITISLFAADARVERWNLRIDRLKKLQTNTVSEKIDKDTIIKLTENGIKSSEEFLNILDKYMKEDGSLKSETKKYTIKEIEKKVTDLSMAAISLQYMHDIYKAAANPAWKEKITGEITQYTKGRLGESAKITPNDMNLIAEQYIFEKASAEFQAALNEATSEILSKSAYELSRTDYTLNDIDVNRIIQRCIENTLSEKNFLEYSKFNETYLTSVPQWKYIEAKHSAQSDPKKYIELHQYKTNRYIYYISFFEQLTSGTIRLSESGSEKLLTSYKGVMPKILKSCRNLFKPEAISAISTEERAVLNKEHLKDYAAINAHYRTIGSQHVANIRKNYEGSVAGFSHSTALKKESFITSESRIGQDETDRLFNFAKKCADAIAAMNYTEEALKKYKNEYLKISEELKLGAKNEILFNNDNGATFSAIIGGVDPDLIERETITRELIAKEGMETLSGAITLVQYYKKKGAPIDFVPSNEEIAAIKSKFSSFPEIIVSSWRMNGKNFKKIDTNVSVELKKMQNKNAWNNKTESTGPEEFTINNKDNEDKGKIKVTFIPPSGWNKVSGNDNKDLCFESPDMKALIKITSINDKDKQLQDLASSWPKNNGFTMTGKNWGKKNDCEYIKSTAKNRYNRIMESYMIAKNGHIIILSGETSGDMYKYLTKTLDSLFTNINIQ